MGRLDVGHPVADSFVNGVLKGARPRPYGTHFGAQQLHSEDVQRLAADIFFAHVDDALQSQHCAHSGGSDAVLAGARFGHYAWLTHSLHQ